MQEMLTVKIRIPDSAEPLRVSLPEAGAALVGREPREDRLSAGAKEAVQGLSVHRVPVASERVSSNHVLLVRQGGQVRLWDLGSKNGTWLRLAPEQEVRLEAGTEVSLELANVSKGSRLAGGPKEAEWTTNEEYAAAVLRAVNEWLRQSGLNARASVEGRGPAREEEESTPLADGSRLRLKPVQGLTVDTPWRLVQEKVHAYASEQNLRYEQFQGHEEDFVLASAVMRQAHRELADAAAYGVRVMLLGSTGAGKERLAKCYHQHSRQQRGPYVSVNCAMLKEGLLYAQLFGAKKGSFTGATGDVTGVIESAHEGTLFLDEVGDMDPEVQKALLRFLDTRGEYQRLGESQVRHANVQIVCATNLALDDAEYRRGRFRDDLWYRLGVKVVRIPPLRERPEDVLTFLRMRTLRGGQIRVYEALSEEAVRHVVSDPLPGNFRDLENFVDRLPPVAGRGTIDAQTCAGALQEGRKPSSGARAASVAKSTPGAGGRGADWEAICALAIEGFRQDQGETPKNWGQLQVFIEKYVKPLFVAHACDLAGVGDLSKTTNYSELARRLLIADGSTVKSHLLRYIDRFSKKAAQ
jgi:DNA-binding NtrC family response regulator